MGSGMSRQNQSNGTLSKGQLVKDANAALVDLIHSNSEPAENFFELLLNAIIERLVVDSESANATQDSVGGMLQALKEYGSPQLINAVEKRLSKTNVQAYYQYAIDSLWLEAAQYFVKINAETKDVENELGFIAGQLAEVNEDDGLVYTIEPLSANLKHSDFNKSYSDDGRRELGIESGESKIVIKGTKAYETYLESVHQKVEGTVCDTLNKHANRTAYSADRNLQFKVTVREVNEEQTSDYEMSYKQEIEYQGYWVSVKDDSGYDPSYLDSVSSGSGYNRELTSRCKKDKNTTPTTTGKKSDFQQGLEQERAELLQKQKDLLAKKGRLEGRKKLLGTLIKELYKKAKDLQAQSKDAFWSPEMYLQRAAELIDLKARLQSVDADADIKKTVRDWKAQTSMIEKPRCALFFGKTDTQKWVESNIERPVSRVR